MKKSSGRISVLSVAVIFLYILVTITNYQKYNWSGRWGPFQYDQFGYYAYLPALFVYGDLNFDFVKKLPENEPQIFWPTEVGNGKVVNKYPIGMAVVSGPFFLMAHYLSPLFSEPQDGFSLLYRIAPYFSTLFYLLIALIYQRKILSKYFSDIVASMALVATALGTNYYYYTAHEILMSHSVGFCLFTLFIYHSIKWHENHKPSGILVLSFLLGLITIIRPTNIIIALFFICYGCQNRKILSEKIIALWKQKIYILMGILVFGLILFPQLYYWKIQTGNWLFYSYGNNEKFYWTDPAIYKGLFSYQKGWFVYTPMMLFAITGLYFVYQKQRDFFWPIMVFVIVNVYIVLSWWSWWYGGGFGLRAFIESEALLIFGLASLIEFFISLNNKYFKIASITALLGITVLNLFQTYQYKRIYIHWEGTTKEMYWQVFGRAKIPSKELDEIHKKAITPTR